MQKVEAKLREYVSKVLHPGEGDINRDKLEKFLLDMIDQLEVRANSSGKIGNFEGNVQTLVEVCAKLWEEKEKWHKKYYDMADRYNRHLDDEIETYNRMLGKFGR
jgi:hypothetical protein